MHSAAAGWAWVRAAVAIEASPLGIGEQIERERRSSLPGASISDSSSRTALRPLYHLLGVAPLMVVGGGGKGDQQGRLARTGGKFGHGLKLRCGR